MIIIDFWIKVKLVYIQIEAQISEQQFNSLPYFV